MLQLGIFTKYFGGAIEPAAKAIRSLGFNTVQLDLRFDDLDLSAGQITAAKAKKVRDTFRDHDLPICCISAYTNILHPDPARRQANRDRVREILRNARALGSPYVVVQSGTGHAEDEWTGEPANRSEASFDACRAAIADLVREAHDHGATLLLETYANNVVGSVEETARMFAQIGHPALGLVMDPPNYFVRGNIDRMDSVLGHAFDVLSPWIRIAHAKDVRLPEADGDDTLDLPAPGRGRLNYELYLRRLSQAHPNLPVILEHIAAADIAQSRNFLKGRMTALGV